MPRICTLAHSSGPMVMRLWKYSRPQSSAGHWALPRDNVFPHCGGRGKLFSTPTRTQAIFEQDLNGRLNCNFVLQNLVLLMKLDFWTWFEPVKMQFKCCLKNGPALEYRVLRYKIAIQASIQMLFKNGLGRGRGGNKSLEVEMPRF